MIAYATLGTNDLPRAAAFYEKLLASLGVKRLMETERIIIWGKSMKEPMFSVCLPYDGKTATIGNGTMISLAAPSKGDVDSLYKLALELGGTDEGAPGLRGGSFYIGYFRDLDGNKLNFFAA